MLFRPDKKHRDAGRFVMTPPGCRRAVRAFSLALRNRSPDPGRGDACKGRRRGRCRRQKRVGRSNPSIKGAGLQYRLEPMQRYLVAQCGRRSSRDGRSHFSAAGLLLECSRICSWCGASQRARTECDQPWAQAGGGLRARLGEELNGVGVRLAPSSGSGWHGRQFASCCDASGPLMRALDANRIDPPMLAFTIRRGLVRPLL